MQQYGLTTPIIVILIISFPIRFDWLQNAIIFSILDVENVNAIDILNIINIKLIFVKICLIDNHKCCIMLPMEVIPDEYKLQ